MQLLLWMNVNVMHDIFHLYRLCWAVKNGKGAKKIKMKLLYVSSRIWTTNLLPPSNANPVP